MPDVSTIYNSHGTRCAGLVAAVVSIHVYMYIYMYMYRWNWMMYVDTCTCTCRWLDKVC